MPCLLQKKKSQKNNWGEIKTRGPLSVGYRLQLDLEFPPYDVMSPELGGFVGGTVKN